MPDVWWKGDVGEDRLKIIVNIWVGPVLLIWNYPKEGMDDQTLSSSIEGICAWICSHSIYIGKGCWFSID